jgi:predicted membrane channel-forming protein YqfA (hemolysin III family)
MGLLATVAGIGQSDCERVVGATLAQPVLAATSLAYVAAGLAVLCSAVRVRGAVAAAAGVVLIAVGAGSFAYHGPQPSWAGPAHDWPIIALAAVYAVGLARTLRRQRRMWMVAGGIFALALITYAAGRSGSPLCRPDSLWQYHGAWHVLSAAAAVCAVSAMGHRTEGAPASHGGQSDP